MTKPTIHRPQTAAVVDATGLLAELRELIHSARQRVATVANAEQIVVSVSRQLGWNLARGLAKALQSRT